MRAALLLVAAAACDAVVSPPGEPCGGSCVLDPRAHCVRIDACRTARDCPHGTGCVRDVCRPPLDEQPERSRELLSLGVPRMEVSRQEDTSRFVLTWEAPPDARLVVCALFACPPEIVAAEERSTVDGHRFVRIANHEQCVLAEERAAGVSGSFDLSNGNLTYDGGEPVCAASDPAIAAFTVTFLAAGCWAYSDSKLIAASDLVRVRPTEIFDYWDAIPRSDCTQGGASCWDQARDRYGSCAEGECRPRCVTDEDCAEGLRSWNGSDGLPPASDAGPPDAPPSPEWECRKLPGRFVGACFRRPAP